MHSGHEHDGWEEAHDPGDADVDGTSSFLEVLITVGIALLLAYVVQGYIIKPYRIPSGSMEHTLKCGDRVLVDRVVFHLRNPQRGDVVVFHPPASVSSTGKVDANTTAGDRDAGK